MKKIIDNKRYDTDTADEIASWDNGLGAGDFHDCYEALYRTKNKRFFIHGVGGAATSWSTSCGNGHTSGEGIRPIDEDEAREWLEHHGETEAIEELFEVEDA